jgi:hypothetical protein
MQNQFLAGLKIGSLMLFCISLGLAQSQTTGRIAGLVRDPSGVVIAGAAVGVKNLATGEVRHVVTDDTGRYDALLLSPGAYEVTVSASGLQQVIFTSVRVAVTETTTINADLAIGPMRESITIIETSPLLQNDGPQLGRVVDARGVAELPLATRNFTQILGLSPGTATYLPDSTAVGRNTQAISVNGARVTQNNLQINGVDANTMGTNGPILVAVPAPETIQEFKVQTSLYDATYGRAGGANIQVLTKSGSNSFHGVAYEYFRNDALNANNPFLKASGVARPVLRRNVFGTALGGPLRKDRAFFFGSYQGARENNGASIINSLSSAVLVASGLTDDRSNQTLRATFGVPAVHPAALALLNAKLPTGQFVIPTPQADGRYSGSAPSTFREEQFNANLDYRLRAANTLAVKFFFANQTQELALPSFRGTGPNVPGFGTDQTFDNRVLTVQNVHAFTPTSFNEVRAGYALNRNRTVPQVPITDTQVGIARSNAGVLPGLPLIRIAPGAGGVIIGTPTNINPALPAVLTLADTVSLVRGKHTLRLGLEVRYNKVDFENTAFSRGQIDFQSFSDFLTGATQVSTFGNGIGDRNQRAWDYNFFLQDDWKISPRLTANFGLRYELDLPPYDTRGRLTTFDPALYRPRQQVVNGDPVGPPAAGFVQESNVIRSLDLPGVPNVAKGLLGSADHNNIAPRIGFAYALLPSGRLVARGGYGIFHSRPTFQYSSLAATLPPSYVIGVRNGAPLADPFFAVPPPEQFPTFVIGVPLSGSVFDRNICNAVCPAVQPYRAVRAVKNLLVEVGYVGTRGTNLFRQVAINQARLASTQNPIINEVTGATITTNTPANASLRAPFQGVSINGFTQNQTSAQSSYNSLQASLSRRVSHGLQLLASYTFAKSMDNASGAGGGAGLAGVVNTGAVGDTGGILGNQLDNRANRGVSDFDRTHRLILSLIWDLPRPRFSQSSTAARLLLSNWQVSGIVTVMSGLPVDVADTGAGSFYGLNQGNSPLARPNFASGANCENATNNIPTGFFFNPLRLCATGGAGRPAHSKFGRCRHGWRCGIRHRQCTAQLLAWSAPDQHGLRVGKVLSAARVEKHRSERRVFQSVQSGEPGQPAKQFQRCEWHGREHQRRDRPGDQPWQLRPHYLHKQQPTDHSICRQV